MKRHTQSLLEAEFLTASQKPGLKGNRIKMQKIGSRLFGCTCEQPSKVKGKDEAPALNIIPTHY